MSHINKDFYLTYIYQYEAMKNKTLMSNIQ